VANCDFLVIVRSEEDCTPTDGCCVTGGSKKQDSSFQSANIKTTTPKFVSHGGEAGAAHTPGKEFGRDYSPDSPQGLALGLAASADPARIAILAKAKI